MTIKNKNELALPYKWESLHSGLSKDLVVYFLTYHIGDIMDADPYVRFFGLTPGERLEAIRIKFAKLTTCEKIATLSDAYTQLLKDNDEQQTADIAGGIFYFLTLDASSSCNIKSAELLYENALCYGYPALWCTLIEAAIESKVVGNNSVGIDVIKKIRKRGIKFTEAKDAPENGGELYERIFMNMLRRESEDERVYPPINWAMVSNTIMIILTVATIWMVFLIK